MGATASRDHDDLIDNMVKNNHIITAHVEHAMRLVDRAQFFPLCDSCEAYKDTPYKTTAISEWEPGLLHISAPSIYCTALEYLDVRVGQTFLNIGSGSGYLNTVVGFLLGENGVNHGIEVHHNLVTHAVNVCEKTVDTKEVSSYPWTKPFFFVGNGLAQLVGDEGKCGRYDRIYCGATVSSMDNVCRIVRMLEIGGKLVAPYENFLVLFTRTSDTDFTSDRIIQSQFANLIRTKKCDDRNVLPAIHRPQSLRLQCRQAIRHCLNEATATTYERLLISRIHLKSGVASDDHDETVDGERIAAPMMLMHTRHNGNVYEITMNRLPREQPFDRRIEDLELMHQRLLLRTREFTRRIGQQEPRLINHIRRNVGAPDVLGEPELPPRANEEDREHGRPHIDPAEIDPVDDWDQSYRARAQRAEDRAARIGRLRARVERHLQSHALPMFDMRARGRERREAHEAQDTESWSTTRTQGSETLDEQASDPGSTTSTSVAAASANTSERPAVVSELEETWNRAREDCARANVSVVRELAAEHEGAEADENDSNGRESPMSPFGDEGNRSESNSRSPSPNTLRRWQHLSDDNEDESTTAAYLPRLLNEDLATEHGDREDFSRDQPIGRVLRNIDTIGRSQGVDEDVQRMDESDDHTEAFHELVAENNSDEDDEPGEAEMQELGNNRFFDNDFFMPEELIGNIPVDVQRVLDVGNAIRAPDPPVNENRHARRRFFQARVRRFDQLVAAERRQRHREIPANTEFDTTGDAEARSSENAAEDNSSHENPTEETRRKRDGEEHENVKQKRVRRESETEMQRRTLAEFAAEFNRRLVSLPLPMKSINFIAKKGVEAGYFHI